MSKKHYKYPERRIKINKKVIISLIVIIATSTLIATENRTNSTIIIEFVKNPLNIIAIISLFRPLLIIEPSKKEFYTNIEEVYERLKERDKINEQIEKNACL
ncbi:MAG: hypothetical protein ACK4M1_03225 [Flavobacterium sp.]